MLYNVFYSENSSYGLLNVRSQFSEMRGRKLSRCTVSFRGSRETLLLILPGFTEGEL